MSRIDWDSTPIVEVFVATCPKCNGTRYVPIRGWTDPDGGKTSRRVCKECGTAYVVISLLPELGKEENAIGIFQQSKGA